jgi:hypothetical protein
MQKHEYFEELIALAAVGQLSVEEHGGLSEHMRSCDRCRRASHQFDFILDRLPLPEASVNDLDLQQLQSASYRRRFLKRASAEGVRFTPDAFGERRRGITTSFFRNWRPYALGVASAVVVVMVAAATLVPGMFSRMAVKQASVSRSELPGPTHPTLHSLSDSSTRDSSSAVVAKLQHANIGAERRLEVLRQKLAQAQADYQRLLQESDQWKDQVAQLQSKSQQDEQQIGQARAQVENLSKNNDQLTAGLVAQQFHIKDLSEEVETQKAAVERERQLTAASSDVRELMAARNLHVIDVADLDAQGKSKKSFGRVFYTERKSLIFYAFDLSQRGSASKVSFQAWGQGAGSDVKNLGVFHVDDQAQKRWVLRVDDPELLKSVESVFVTVEPGLGGNKPSGQRLLYAYLGSQANHP